MFKKVNLQAIILGYRCKQTQAGAAIHPHYLRIEERVIHREEH